jgi:V/A-type H+-transporting ATPase subunit I
MIVPARMLKVRMIVYHEDSQRLLESLRGTQTFHFSDFASHSERWDFKGIPNQEEYEDLMVLYGGISGLIDTLGGESKGFLADIIPPRIGTQAQGYSLEGIHQEVVICRQEVGRLLSEKKALEKARSDMVSHSTAIGILEGFRSQIERHELPKKTRVCFGEIPDDELTPLLISLKDQELDENVFYKKVKRDDEKKAVLLVLADERKAGVLDKILEKHSLQSIPLPEDGNDVLSLLGRVRGELAELEAKERKVKEELGASADTNLGNLRSYLARVKSEIDMMKVRNMLGRTDMTLLVDGWIKEKDKARFEEIVQKAAEGRAEIFYSEPDVRMGDVPVALENPGFIKPFEMLTRMFSPPNYGEIDPTPFLALAFVLFFGIMFADMFDALMLLAMSFVFYTWFKGSEDAKSTGEILIVCSLSALAFGIVGGDFAGFSIWAKQAVLQPANLLVFALFLGLVQIALGFVLGAVNAARENDMRELVGGKIGWLLIIAGVLLGYFLQWEYGLLSVLGLGLILALKGLREALDLTRLLSNVLSYVRLLALNMAHVGLSATFASITGGLFALGLVGQVSGGIIVIIAHVFLVVVSLFAVFAHALRLQYVEFFSKFYEGGGTTFNPF